MKRSNEDSQKNDKKKVLVQKKLDFSGHKNDNTKETNSNVAEEGNTQLE